jgi:ketosteroid isomerase-like protein
LLIGFLYSCNEKEKRPREEKAMKSLELLGVDREFSDMSKKEGMKAAYLHFLDDSNGVLLRTDHLPIVAANAIDYITQQNDNTYTLSWDPHRAEIAESGEMGYTYGIYLIRPKAMDTSIYGTYTNFWKKNALGKWRLMMNSYNEGIGE